MFFKDNLCRFNKFKEFNIKKIKNKRFSMNIMEIEDWMVVPQHLNQSFSFSHSLGDHLRGIIDMSYAGQF